MKLNEIDHCGMIVPNLAKAVAWYETTLGFVPIAVRDDIKAAPDWKIAFLHCESAKLELLEQKSMPGKEQAPPESNAAFTGKKHVAFAVNDLDQSFNYLAERGVSVVRPITELPELGVRFCHFSDPWGNMPEFVERSRAATSARTRT